MTYYPELQSILLVFNRPEFNILVNSARYNTYMTPYFVEYKTEQYDCQILVCGRFTYYGKPRLLVNEIVNPLIFELANSIQAFDGSNLIHFKESATSISLYNLDISKFPIWTGPLN
jgi:hypothetical protein